MLVFNEGRKQRWQGVTQVNLCAVGQARHEGDGTRRFVLDGETFDGNGAQRGGGV
jgi:hypothetical protein